MPALLSTLLLLRLEEQFIPIDFLSLLGGDDTDFIVFPTQLTSRIGDGMNMEFGCGRLAGELAETLNELFLQVIVYIVLLAEEHHTSLRDFSRVSEGL